ncbi:hypothetical protein RRF57_009561 [Xylaria bambusicola]|uniref:Uncharacterized protein n=1 Tax=Xylaria bambusicola TaxID=326684 RepID=A0AAN7Z922_9PEZI
MLDVGNNTNDRDRNGPEDDEGADKADSSKPADYPLPPRHPQCAPNHLTGSYADVLGGHLQSLVMCQYLERRFRISLVREFDEDAVDLLVFAITIFVLAFLYFWNETFKFGSAPCDCVHLLAD